MTWVIAIYGLDSLSDQERGCFVVSPIVHGRLSGRVGTNETEATMPTAKRRTLLLVYLLLRRQRADGAAT